MIDGAAQGRRPGPGALDDAVRAVLAQGVDPSSVAERLASLPSVSEARVRPGRVKTEPPQLEVEVDYAAAPGVPATRVYDLAELPDGSLEWAGVHE